MPFTRTVTSLATSFVLISGIWLYDWIILEADRIPNAGPSFSPWELTKVMLMAGLSAWIVLAIINDGRERRSAAEPQGASVPVPLIAGVHLLALGFVILFIVDPQEFHVQSLEDSAVEYASAVLCLGGAVLFGRTFLGAFRSPGPPRVRRRILVLSFLGAFVLFLIAMEEISWGQRILGIETPESFSGNAQGETNLHNFLTKPIHNAYRLACWATLIVLPFLLAMGPASRLWDHFRGFLPHRTVAALAVPLAAFNFNAWPFMPVQIIFFSSVLIMLALAMEAHRVERAGEAVLFLSGALVAVMAQAVFLSGGDSFVRKWDVTEYQEFFMALGLAVVAWSSARQCAPYIRPDRLSTSGRTDP